MKKWILSGISILAVSLLVIGSQVNVVGYNTTVQSMAPQSVGTVRVCVIESRGDGRQKRTMISFSSDQYRQYQQELKGAKDINSSLFIYKKYGLIPRNVTMENLRLEVKERARQLNFTSQKIESLRKTILNTHVFFDVCSFIYINNEDFMSPIRVIIKCILLSLILGNIWVPTINLLQVHLFPSDYQIKYFTFDREFTDVVFAVLFGFVGFSIITIDTLGWHWPYTWPYISSFQSFGYTVLTFGIRNSPN